MSVSHITTYSVLNQNFPMNVGKAKQYLCSTFHYLLCNERVKSYIFSLLLNVDMVAKNQLELNPH